MTRTFAFVLALALPALASAQDWRGAANAGGDLWIAPELGGHGFALFDVVGSGLIAGGNLHLLYNTDTLQAGVEGIPVADGRVQLALVARGEAIFAGLLGDYYQRGLKVSERGFNASYLQLTPQLKWNPAGHHTLEVTGAVRRWWFGRQGSTADDLVLPPEAWVFEPRLGYIFWMVDAPGQEWEAHRLYQRITGIAVGVWLGIDVRTDASAWGAMTPGGLDPRNDPAQVIFTARQQLRAGVELTPLLRLQLEQQASWGEGEDDLTRVRAGGMTPYVVPVAGLPWAAILSERLLAGQASLHLKLGEGSAQELGVLVGGGAFNDIEREGRLRHFGGAGGAALFADLRFGAWQLYARLGLAFPAGWQDDPPHLSALLAVGVRTF